MNFRKAILAAALAVLCGSSALASRPVAHKYENPTGKQFPIMTWFSLNNDELTPERYREMADAGFNISFSHIFDNAELEKALKACKGTGIKIMTPLPRNFKGYAEFFKKFKGNKDIIGWFMADEPWVKNFPEMAAMADSALKYDKSRILYLNLLPIGEWGAKNYYDYVSSFIKDVNLGLVSYDMYPVQIVEGVGLNLRADYYQALETLSKACSEANQPLWGFSLATAHKPYPVAEEHHIRIQLFSNLAYGAQGLQYFTYTTPMGTAWDFHNAPIDSTGRRTEVYDIVSAVNHEIQNLAWVFLGAKVVNVAHEGAVIPMGTSELKSLPTPFKSVKSEGGDGVVVSHLTNGKNHFLLVLNRDILHRQKVTVLRNKKVNRVMPSGKMVDADLYNPDLWLNPGGYLLYQWTE